MKGGWTGTLLRVDLTRGKIDKEQVNTEWARDYIGGRRLATRYLYEEGVATVDPLSAENKLILATDHLTGTGAPCGARYMVATKGPLSGIPTLTRGPNTRMPGLWVRIPASPTCKPS